ncbi:MAG: hypothetical protein E7162_01205 [Firmicutes bacterium]|nr:hypothetical protein [Bacillota bacterium]
MKNIIKRMLLITGVCSVIVILFSYLSVYFADFNLFTVTSYFFEQSPEVGLVLFPIAILADLANALALMFVMFVIPSFIAIIIFGIQLISRLFQIGGIKKWKNTVSKVLSYISISIQILLSIYLVLIFISTLNLLLIVSCGAIITAIVLNIKEIKKIKNV